MIKRKRNNDPDPQYDLMKCFKNEYFPKDVDYDVPVYLQLKNNDPVPRGKLFISVENIETGCLDTLRMLEKITFPYSGARINHDERTHQIFRILLAAYKKQPERENHVQAVQFLLHSKDQATLQAMVYVMMSLVAGADGTWTPPIEWMTGFGAIAEANDLLTRLVKTRKIFLDMENGKSVFQQLTNVVDTYAPRTVRQLSFISLYSEAKRIIITVCDIGSPNIVQTLSALQGFVLWRYRGDHKDPTPTKHLLNILQSCILCRVYLWIPSNGIWKDFKSVSNEQKWNRIASKKLVESVSVLTNSTPDVALLVILYCRESAFGPL